MLNRYESPVLSPDLYERAEDSTGIREFSQIQTCFYRGGN